MKAISLWQPYATLIAIGAKHYETRSWSTDYRGTLVIHAAKRWTREEERYALMPNFASVLKASGLNPLHLPLGCAICVVDLVDIWTTERAVWKEGIDAQEMAFGNYGPGRFAWQLANVRVLNPPIPAQGKQGLFEWTLPLPEGVLK